MFNLNAFSQPSVMKHDFSKVPHADIQRSRFKRSHGYKSVFEPDYIYPIYCDEVLPGDTFSVKLSSVARIATLIQPIMDNMKMDFFFFFVPNRLLWNNFDRFMGERRPDTDSSIDYQVPEIDFPVGGWPELSLYDYMGIPIDVEININALHPRAYNLIYNEWFRDQNLIDRVPTNVGDGPDVDTDYVLLKRAKFHDYFTSCLPWPQKGDAVDLPLGSTAPVVTSVTDRTFASAEEPLHMWLAATGSYAFGSNYNIGAAQTTGDVNITQSGITMNGGIAPSNLWADLSNATASTINSLREAFQLQRLMERDARGGTRYTEIIRSHFGVTSPDARLQRPEYLGGGSRNIIVDPVPSTSQVVGRDLGALGACAYCNQSGIGFTKSFTEHGVILGLLNVRADLTYQQGLDRMWSRQTRYDFYWPSLAHLGEQEVLNKEIFADGTANDDLVFGYQERWAEYRYKNSLITGQLRSTNSTPLDIWHLSQEFGALPVLNQSFIESAVPIDRVVVDLNDPVVVFDGYFDVTVTRPMPMYSVPGLIDHF